MCTDKYINYKYTNVYNIIYTIYFCCSDVYLAFRHKRSRVTIKKARFKYDGTVYNNLGSQVGSSSLVVRYRKKQTSIF